MGALLDEFSAAGIAFTQLPGGRLNVTGPLDEPTRAAIREHKAALLAELSAANDATTPEQAAELRDLIARILANDSEANRAEALAVALGDPEVALISYRTLAAAFSDQYARPREDDPRRPCLQCANLSNNGQCLAAWRGEAKDWPWFAPQNYHRSPTCPTAARACGH